MEHPLKTCETCGALFHAQVPEQVTCSQSCYFKTHTHEVRATYSRDWVSPIFREDVCECGASRKHDARGAGAWEEACYYNAD